MFQKKTHTGNPLTIDGAIKLVCTHCCKCALCIRLKLCQIQLIPNCRVVRQIGLYVVVLERVPIDQHMTEEITRVHLVNLHRFEWEDSATNVSVYKGTIFVVA